MRTKVFLFVTAVILGGLGGALGSIVGNAFGKTGLFAGGVVGGLVASLATGKVAAGRHWIAPESWARVTVGAAVGFLLAALIATRTLSSPIGPVFSTALIGIGALLGARSRSNS
ncbi:MAG: hypothetical protein H0U64_05090 [Gemmatimonadaceae bacterium]|nr:hypothetical protein [Gemmatimonadaceae bacterium]